MLDLNKMMNDALVKIEKEGFVEETIEKRVKGTLESIIDDLFKPWSDFGKKLKAEIQEKLQINLEQLDIASYNHLLGNMIQGRLNEVMHNQGVEKMKLAIDDLLKGAKEEYKLSELIEMMKEEEDQEEHYGEEISLHVDDSCSYITFIYFDPEGDKSDYECKYKITVGDENKISSIRIDDKSFDNKVIMGGLYGLEAELFKMFATGSKLIVDEGDVEPYYGEDY